MQVSLKVSCLPLTRFGCLEADGHPTHVTWKNRFKDDDGIFDTGILRPNATRCFTFSFKHYSFKWNNFCTVGPLGNMPLKDEDKNPIQEGIEVGTGLINCGVKDNCGDDAFSVQMYTGFKNLAMAKLCVNGK